MQAAYASLPQRQHTKLMSGLVLMMDTVPLIDNINYPQKKLAVLPLSPFIIYLSPFRRIVLFVRQNSRFSLMFIRCTCNEKTFLKV